MAATCVTQKPASILYDLVSGALHTGNEEAGAKAVAACATLAAEASVRIASTLIREKGVTIVTPV
jgi:hypothetical protein